MAYSASCLIAKTAATQRKLMPISRRSGSQLPSPSTGFLGQRFPRTSVHFSHHFLFFNGFWRICVVIGSPPFFCWLTILLLQHIWKTFLLSCLHRRNSRRRDERTLSLTALPSSTFVSLPPNEYGTKKNVPKLVYTPIKRKVALCLSHVCLDSMST